MGENFPDNKEKLEVEAKFICPDGLNFDSLLVVISDLGFQYRKENPCFQTDVYLDSSGYTLLKYNSALRIRQSGENYVGAYKTSGKQQGAVFKRKEFEWTLSNDEAESWIKEKKPMIPQNILDKLNLHGQPLRKVLVVETHRKIITINDKDRFCAELSLDEVIFRGHKGQKSYREIELELLQGELEQFNQVTKGLQNRLKLQPAIDSKYKKGMLFVGKYSGKNHIFYEL